LLKGNFLVGSNQNVKFIPDKSEKPSVADTIPTQISGNQDYVILYQVLPQFSGD